MNAVYNQGKMIPMNVFALNLEIADWYIPGCFQVGSK